MSQLQEKAKKLTIEDLAVVNFGSKELNSAIEQWRETATVCAAQSCARQTWFGTVDELKDFPLKNKMSDKLDYLVGKEAYLFLLRLMLGLETKENIAETNITGQINEGWRVFSEKMPEESAKLRHIFDGLKADSRLIRDRNLGEYTAPTLANAAIKLVEKKSNDIVTIIAHGERNGGSLSTETEDLIKRFGTVKKNFASEIIILGSDSGIRNMALKFVNGLRSNGYLQPDVTITIKTGSISNIQDSFNKSSLVFCAKPMVPNSEESEFEDNMVLGWDNRISESPIGKFVHLNGVPQLRGKSSKLWEDFGLQGYISPENVANQRDFIYANNDKVVGLAKHNASRFARIRYEGRQPGKKDLSMD
jgi:hypothetical protein